VLHVGHVNARGSDRDDVDVTGSSTVSERAIEQKKNRRPASVLDALHGLALAFRAHLARDVLAVGRGGKQTAELGRVRVAGRRVYGGDARV
jgi:hypothetical protein